jgi:hypothetical protein
MLQKIHIKLINAPAWLDAVLLVLLAAFIVSGITLVPFHGDEAAYINLSGDYDVVIKQGNLGAFLLTPENPDPGIRLSTGSVLGFLIGFVRDVTGMGGSVNNNWSWDQTWSENIEQGNMPNRQLLTLSRACSALMGALGVVFLFLSARHLLGSRLSVWATAFLLATHGDVLVNFRRAMQEGLKFFFLLVTLYLSTQIMRGLKYNKTSSFLYVLMGLASGFTLATKQDTVPMLVAIYLALILIPFLNKEKKNVILANILYLGSAGILAFASFLALMPVFWGWWRISLMLIGFSTLLFQIPVWRGSKAAKLMAFLGCALIVGMIIGSPLEGFRIFVPISKMMQVRKSVVKNQVNYRIDNDLFYLNTVENKTKFLLETVLRSNVMYMEVATFDIDPVNGQIAAYETSHIQGRINSPVLDAIILILFIIGAWTLLRRFDMESLLIFSLFLVTAIFIIAAVSLPWQRYYLIMQIPYSLIAGAGVEYTWVWGKKFIGQSIS